jgi:predicted permease
MGSMLQDLRYGARMLWKKPGFTAVVVVSLGLGIGANAAIFSVVNAVLLRPLPYPNPERLLVLEDADTRNPEQRGSVAAPDFFDWRARNTTLEGVAAFHYSTFILTGGGEPESLTGVFAAHGFTEVLGVAPLLGRSFTAEEDAPRQRARAALLSYGLWQRRFAAAPDIVGQTIHLNSEPYTIIGVMPESFRYPNRRVDIWAPAGLDPARIQGSKHSYLQVIARRKADATIEQARADLANVAAIAAQEHPDTNEFSTVSVTGLLDKTLGNFRLALLVISGAVAFVLLIACANAANLLLARATARQKEMSIRLALGAGRGRIVRQLLTESLLLAFLGGALGVGLAAYGVDALLKFMPASMRALEIAVNGSVLLFTLGVSLITGFLFGLYPAWRAARTSLGEALKEGGGKSSPGGDSRRFRQALVVGETALTLVLLIGAGLLLQSFRRLQSVDPGFDSDRVLTMNVALPRAKYAEPSQQAAFFDGALENLRALPGVRSAAVVTNLPLGSSLSASSFRIDGRPEPKRGESPSANRCVISPDYFRTMGIGLLRGRDFDDRDAKTGAGVVIVNQALVARYFPDEDPLGKYLTIGTPEEEALYGRGVSREIIGVVGNSRFALDRAADPEMYVSYKQLPESTLTVVLKTAGNPAGVAQSAREAIYRTDPNQPVRAVRSMEELLGEALVERRFNALLIGVFAAIALILASVGIYGVMSYNVTQRTNEIGVRIALGAQPGQVLRMVIGNGMKLALFGVGAGLAAALVLTKYLQSILYEVDAGDPVIIGGIAVFLGAVALVACWAPARRATKVDPMTALRHD